MSGTVTNYIVTSMAQPFSHSIEPPTNYKRHQKQNRFSKQQSTLFEKRQKFVHNLFTTSLPVSRRLNDDV